MPVVMPVMMVMSVMMNRRLLLLLLYRCRMNRSRLALMHRIAHRLPCWFGCLWLLRLRSHQVHTALNGSRLRLIASRHQSW